MTLIITTWISRLSHASAQQIGIHDAPLCDRNIVFQHKINFCVVEHIVCFPCVRPCFICVTFEFPLGSCVFTWSLRCYRGHGELKMVSIQHCEHKTSRTHASINLLGKSSPEPMLTYHQGCSVAFTWELFRKHLIGDYFIKIITISHRGQRVDDHTTWWSTLSYYSHRLMLYVISHRQAHGFVVFCYIISSLGIHASYLCLFIRDP